MKKKLWLLLALAGSILCALFGLTACGEAGNDGNDKNDSPAVHMHTMTKHDAVEPTCTTDGNVLYYSCSDCHKNFADKEGKIELTETVISATGHAMTKHDAVEPTCTTAGNVLYYSCSNCHKNFVEKEGKTELTETAIPETEHTWSTTYTEDGDKHYQSCKDCDEKKYSDHNFTNGNCVCGKEKPPTEGLKYELNSDGEGYTVTDIGTATELDILIPALCNGKPVTSIGQWAFENCSSLTSVTIPDSVTNIESDAFSGCRSLTSVTIPDSVTSIGSGAFEDCSSLTSVTIPDSVTSIEEGAFAGCRVMTSVTIPDSVTSIGANAFFNCHAMTSVTIPDGVTDIGSYAFFNCRAMTSIVIPDSVTDIGYMAFQYCDLLTSVVVGENNQNFASQDGILYNKEKTQFIHIPQALKGAVTIPDSVTSIGDRAFSFCRALTSVTIPDSVTSIGGSAFYDCRLLTDITYQGTKAEWEAIGKGFKWNDSTGNYTIHCTDGDIKKGE